MPRVINHDNGLNFGLAQDMDQRRALMVLLQGSAD
jgi:hypothetical protein